MIAGRVDDTPGVFMLDTGSPFSFLVNRDFVPLPEGKPVSKGGAASGQQIAVQLHEGPRTICLERDNLFAVSQIRSGDLGFVGKALNVPFLGFIGLELLRDREFTIDYRNKTVILFPPADDGSGSEQSVPLPLAVFAFTLKEQIPRIMFDIGDLEIAARLDTGAQGSVVLSAASRKNLTAAHLLVQHGRGEKAKLEIKSARYKGRGFDLSDLDAIFGVTDEITLGYAFLKDYRTVWNYKKMTVWLFPK